MIFCFFLPSRIMLAHTRAAKKHAKILLFSDSSKFYREKVRF